MSSAIDMGTMNSETIPKEDWEHTPSSVKGLVKQLVSTLKAVLPDES